MVNAEKLCDALTRDVRRLFVRHVSDAAALSLGTDFAAALEASTDALLHGLRNAWPGVHAGRREPSGEAGVNDTSMGIPAEGAAGLTVPGAPLAKAASPETMRLRGLHLARMAALGLNVPPAFVLGTSLCAHPEAVTPAPGAMR
ncbi:hypothetical protein ACVOMV_07385 [Mesorhizobium atlanticum]